VKLANWLIANIGVIDKIYPADRIKGKISSELKPRWTVHPLKALHARVKRSLSTPREPHQRDAVRVNAGMLCKKLERTIGIIYFRELPKPILIGYGVDNPSACEAIDRCNARETVTKLKAPVNLSGFLAHPEVFIRTGAGPSRPRAVPAPCPQLAHSGADLMQPHVRS
jgi:hypothetical protein